jgi:toxin ParE1/3/4
VSRWKIRVSRQAAEDIEGVLSRTLEQFGEGKYSQYQELIHDAFAALKEDPMGPPAKRRPEIHRDAMTFHIGQRGRRARHFLLYRVMDGGFVEIARFLHDAMEPRRHLPRGFF